MTFLSSLLPCFIIAHLEETLKQKKNEASFMSLQRMSGMSQLS